MSATLGQRLADLGERAGWTLLQAGIGEAVVQLATDEAPAWATFAVPLIAAGISVVKSALAQKFGNGTGGTLPASAEPIPQGPKV